MNDAFFVGFGALDACSGFLFMIMIIGGILAVVSIIAAIVQGCAVEERRMAEERKKRE